MKFVTFLYLVFRLGALGYFVEAQNGEQVSTFVLSSDQSATSSPSNVDAARALRSLPSAIQSGRDDFFRMVATSRSPQCAVEGDPNRRSSLTWMVGEHDPNVQYAYESENAARSLSQQLPNGDGAELLAQSQRQRRQAGPPPARPPAAPPAPPGGAPPPAPPPPPPTAPAPAPGPAPAPAPPPPTCLAEKQPQCNSASPFRTMDGTCNNLVRPLWASVDYPQARMGSAAYQDGISAPRSLSVISSPSQRVPLPTAREVSTALSKSRDAENPDTTFMLVQYAQFIAHDISNTPAEKVPDPNNSSNSITVQCCTPNANTNPNCPVHPSCFPIYVPASDRVFGPLNITCMEFVRSKPAPVSGCSLRARVPVNGVASYIDASHIYGNKDSDAKRLRSGVSGMLKINDSPLMKQQNVVMVPGGPNALACIAPSTDKPCVDAGDIRINLHTGLVALHSLFLREHNRIAKFLADRAPPGSTDEMIFQVTRKLVGAMLQHIAYKEMIPLILGRTLYNDPRNGVAAKDTGFSSSYNPNVDATVLIEFAAAAYRLHTLSGNELPVLQDNGTQTPFFLHFFNPNMWYKEGVLDQLIIGMAKKRAQNFDADFSFVFQNQMYKPMNKPTGFDQLAINIQRGRDHGMPTYLQMRKLCGLQPINTLQDLERATSTQNAASLTSVYKNLADVDFYAGGISEKTVNNEGLCGPTFACVLTEQFRRLKMGDRFFYENENVFTPDQLKEIRRVSLATIMCLNSPIDKVQARVLEVASATNPLVSCSDILARSSPRLETFLLK